MGSAIPMFFDSSFTGVSLAPMHNDNFIQVFNASGTIAVGNLVYLSSAWTVSVVPTTGAYPIGVALTSGTLNSGVAVALRGIIEVVTDGSGAVTAGHSLVPSTTVAGAVKDSGSAPSAGNVVQLLALEAASSGSQSIIRALLF
jgi:hypothetical protein